MTQVAVSQAKSGTLSAHDPFRAEALQVEWYPRMAQRVVSVAGGLGFDPPQRVTRPVAAERMSATLPELGTGVAVLARDVDQAVWWLGRC